MIALPRGPQPELLVKGIDDQADRLQEIDRDDYIYRVQNFKRAVAKCEVRLDGEVGAVTIIVDFHGGRVTVSSKHPRVSARDLGIRLMILYEMGVGENLTRLFGGSLRMDANVADFPVGRSPERFRGFLHDLHQRGWTKIDPGAGP